MAHNGVINVAHSTREASLQGIAMGLRSEILDGMYLIQSKLITI